MPQKILYLSYDGLTDPLGQSQILAYLLHLADEDREIHIISFEKLERYVELKNEITQQVNSTNIHWHPLFYTKKPPILSTLKDIWKLRRRVKRFHQKYNFDIVHCRSYITSLAGLWMKRKYKVKFIFDMRGFWADERVDGGLWSLKNPVFKLIYHYFKKKEKAFLRTADCTISLTENAKQEIHNWEGFEKTNIQVIPCCVDIELFDYQKIENQKFDNESFKISYLGSIGTWYMLSEMLTFYKYLLEFRPNARFLFITTEPPEMILSEARKLEIPTQQIQIQKAKRKEVPTLLAQSDLSIYFIKPLYSKKASSPTKMGEILAMGIPIIANTEVGDHQFLFEKYNCGLLLDKFEASSYQAIIKQLDTLDKIPKATLREVAMDYYSLGKGVELYKQVYKDSIF